MAALKFLTPTKILIQTEAKFFGLEKGSSDGTVLAMEFDILPDAYEDKNGFREELFREKLSLDLMALNMERMKGSVPEAVFNSRVSAVKSRYQKVFDAFEAKQKAPDAPTVK